MWLGAWKDRQDRPLGLKWVQKMIIPGVVFGTVVACVARRFWLLSNKGGRGQKNREEIGAGATEKPPARTGGFFESVRMPAYGSFRLVQNARPSIKYLCNFPWESFERLNKSSRQNKIKIWQKH